MIEKLAEQEHAGGECLHLAGPSQVGAVGPAFTWEFDIGSQKWNERASYLVPRWRAISGISAFGRWITGDTKGNRLLTSTRTKYNEVSDPLIVQMESGPVLKFPNRTRVARADFNFVTGVGDATGPDPRHGADCRHLVEQ